MMNYDKIELNNFAEYQKIILLTETTRLIKNKSKQWQSHKNTGKFYYE